MNANVLSVWLQNNAPQCTLAPDAASDTVVVVDGAIEHWGSDCGVQPSDQDIADYEQSTEYKQYWGDIKIEEIYAEQELRTVTVMGSTAIPRDIFDFIEEFFTEAVKPAARNPITQADTPKLWGLQQLRNNRNTLLDGLQQWIDDPAKTWQDIRDFDVAGWAGWAIARPS